MFVPCLSKSSRADGGEAFRLGHPLPDARTWIWSSRGRARTRCSRMPMTSRYFTMVVMGGEGNIAGDVDPHRTGTSVRM